VTTSEKVSMSNNEAELHRCLAFTSNRLNERSVIHHYKTDTAGVYIICDRLFNVLYIGEAKNIIRRLKIKKHPFRKKRPDLDIDELNIICLLINHTKRRHRAETILIGALNPIYNTIKVLHGKTRKH
jgi:hypothetical protein